MKKYLLFAAACIALVACNEKNNPINGEQPETEATPFTKGQVVTIGVSAGDMGNNAPIRKISGTDNGSTIDFKWEAGDTILVTVKDTIRDPDLPSCYNVETYTAKFTLASGAGTASATFTGEMPGSNKWFEIQYPVSSPDLSSQTYEAGKIGSGLMSYKATGCVLNKYANLVAQNAVLQLNLYGIARSVSKIIVSDVGSSAVSYTLNCTDAVIVGTDSAHATPFYIVMNSDAIQLQIDVTMEEGTIEASDLPDYTVKVGQDSISYGKGILASAGTFVQGTAKTIAAGTCVNMPAICITTIWAPVNCGYDSVKYKYGLLYQWGRKDGCRYEFTDKTSDRPQEIPYNDAGDKLQISPAYTEITTTPLPDSYAIIRIGDEYKYYATSETSPIAASEENAAYFYNTTDQKDWLSSKDDYRWDTTGGSWRLHFPKKGDFDPCPEGWRVPTYAEMQTLLGSHTSGGLQTGTHGTATDTLGNAPKGKWFNGTSEAEPTTGVFLPAAGYRVSNASGSAYMRGRVGNYWTSSVSDDRGCRFGFSNGNASMSTNDARSPGYSIRCVKE